MVADFISLLSSILVTLNDKISLTEMIFYLFLDLINIRDFQFLKKLSLFCGYNFFAMNLYMTSFILFFGK